MSRRTANPDRCPVVEHGKVLIDAQRAALIAGDPVRLTALNQEMSDWLAALARDPDSISVASGTLEPLRAALRVNATLAAGAAAQVSQALETLVAQPGQTYGADGRPAMGRRSAGSFSA